RDLTRRQEEILKNMQEDGASDQKSLSESGKRAEALEQLARQKEILTNLVDRATQVSQQAETSEPLLSTQLYDTVRKFSQDSSKGLKEVQDDLLNRGRMTRSLYDRLRESSEPDAAKLEEVASEMLRLGFDPQAQQAAERARRAMEDLKSGVERAAGNILGDDTEALRLAQEELNQLTDQLQREMSQAQGEGAQTNQIGAMAGAPRSGSGTNAVAQRGSNQLAQANSPTQRSAQSEAGDRSGETQSEQLGNSSGSQEESGTPQQSRAASGQEQRAGEESQSAQGRQPGQGQSESASNSNEENGQTQTAQSEREGGQRSPGDRRQGGLRDNRSRASNNAGGGGGNWNWDQVFSNDTWRQYGPLTGENFVPWSDRLREVEEMIEEPGLRNEVAAARERARLMRQEFKRDRKKPDWAVVQLQVMKPLTEVRDRITEELARRESRQAIVPIDRDPVPNRYSDLVRRYYEQLGKEK
ncbi:MAG TPA: hypothetical protein VEC99_03395, partial [Clostridia bacterium]|nr:hypothetical protein [Clostridia bacterium]